MRSNAFHFDVACGRYCMPKGRGNKGNACSRKRKSSLPIQSTVDNPAFLSSSSTCTTTSPKSPPAQSIDLAPQTNPEPNICGAQTNVCFPSPNVFAPGFSSSQHLYGGLASTPWSYGYPHTQALNSPVPASPIPPNMPFVLCKIEGNISICAGCHNKYKKNSLPPDDDLCIRHQEWREFTPSGSNSPQTRFGNAYYHFNPQCIQLRHWFQPNTLEIPSTIHSDLTEVHKTRLRTLFNITI